MKRGAHQEPSRCTAAAPAQTPDVWACIEQARDPARPRMLDYTARLFDEVVELHGDRVCGDDPAVVAGVARFEGQTVAFAGQQKGGSTEERLARNFGMAHPEGYRKALRVFHLAERLHLPVLSFVDTPAAHPGVEAEERGQGPAIARNLVESMRLTAPLFAVVLSEGGSGGALGIAVGDWVAMLEHAVYMICPPERCAEILWRDVEKKALAAQALCVTAADLLRLGVVDAVVPEPQGGAQQDPDAAAEALAAEIRAFLKRRHEGQWTPQRRQAKFRAMGSWRVEGQ